VRKVPKEGWGKAIFPGKDAELIGFQGKAAGPGFYLLKTSGYAHRFWGRAEFFTLTSVRFS